MKTMETEVLIIGNGLAGSTLANALLHHPFFANRDAPDIHILDMSAPLGHFNHDANTKPYDIRISSINRGSENIIRTVGAWHHLNHNRVFPYRFVEVASPESSDQSSLVFDAHENSLSHMGIMVENQHLVYALHQKMQQHQDVCSMHFETKVESIEYNESQKKWHVHTNRGHFICQLLVGADGKNSRVRNAANIEVSKGFYHQKCIVGNITVDGQLNNTAWQRFLTTGPIGVLPMSAEGETPARFSLAWSCDVPLVDSIMDDYVNDKNAFIARLQPLLPKSFGAILDADNIASYPLWHQQANHYHLPGLALIGDAAHSIHPLAGLGANLGIRDAATLAEQLLSINSFDNDDEINFATERYAQRCQQFNALALNTMSVFKNAFTNDSIIPTNFLSKALSLGNRLHFIKSRLLESATGLDKNAPDLSPFLTTEDNLKNDVISIK